MLKKSKGESHPIRIKQLKAENKELMGMIRDNDRLMTSRLKDSQRESEKMCVLIMEIMPLIQKIGKDDPKVTQLIRKLNKKVPAKNKSLIEQVLEKVA